MSDILIYQNDSGEIKVDVRFEDESIWLSQTQICEVFGKAKSTISEHIKAIYEQEQLLLMGKIMMFLSITLIWLSQ